MKCCYCREVINEKVATARNTETNKQICLRCVVGIYGKIITDFMEIAHGHTKEEATKKRKPPLPDV